MWTLRRWIASVRRDVVKISNRLGLHARAAAKFVHTAEPFQSKILVEKGHSRVDGKSILGLLTLAASLHSELILCCDGPDEDQAFEALAALLRSGFGESE